MGCSIAQDKRTIIKTRLELSQKATEISRGVNVSTRTIQRYKMNLRYWGTVRPPKLEHQGRPRKITEEMEEVRSQTCSL